MLELLDQQKRLTRNQKKIVAAAVIDDMLDYFDFGLISAANPAGSGSGCGARRFTCCCSRSNPPRHRI